MHHKTCEAERWLQDEDLGKIFVQFGFVLSSRSYPGRRTIVVADFLSVDHPSGYYLARSLEVKFEARL